MSTRITSWNRYPEIEEKPKVYLWVFLDTLKQNTEKLLKEGYTDESAKVIELRDQQRRVAEELVRRGEAKAIIPPPTKENIERANRPAEGLKNGKDQTIGMNTASLKARVPKG